MLLRSSAFVLSGGSSALQTLLNCPAGLQWLSKISSGSAARGFHSCSAPSSSSSTSSSSTSSSSTSSSSTRSGDSSPPQQQEQHQQQHQQEYPPLYAACVLERLPIVKSPPSAVEAESKAKLMLLQLQAHALKQYPNLDGKQRDAGGKESTSAGDADASSTAADASGAVNTMKRRLRDKLVLLVKAEQNALSAAAAAAGSSGAPAGKGSKGSKGSSSSGVSWTFPHTAHQAGETMRQAAERALRESIGLSQVYFIGNAPMAHLDVSSSSSSADSSSSSSSGAEPPAGRVFFHLAQVVNDPWDVQLAEGGGAADFAWVAKEELEQYIADKQLLQLAHKML